MENVERPDETRRLKSSASEFHLATMRPFAARHSFTVFCE